MLTFCAGASSKCNADCERSCLREDGAAGVAWIDRCINLHDELLLTALVRQRQVF